MTDNMVQSAEAFAASIVGIFNALGVNFTYRLAVAMRVVAASAVWGDVSREDFKNVCLEWYDAYTKVRAEDERSKLVGVN